MVANHGGGGEDFVVGVVLLIFQLIGFGFQICLRTCVGSRLSRTCALKVWETINSLKFGDLIEIEWLDASEATGKLQRAGFDTPVLSVGYFLGVKGMRTCHVVIAKEIIDNAKAFHYNVIPIGMCQKVTVLAKDRLDPKTRRVLKKFVHVAIAKIRGNDGWVYAEGKNKKRLK